MATSSKSRRPASAGRASSSASAGKSDLKSTLKKLGVDESVVDLWRDQAKRTLSKKAQTSIEDFDVAGAIEAAKKYASMSSSKLKDVSRVSPKAFYGGVAAILFGAGLLAAAARSSSAPSAVPRKSGGRKKSAREIEEEQGALDL